MSSFLRSCNLILQLDSLLPELHVRVNNIFSQYFFRIFSVRTPEFMNNFVNRFRNGVDCSAEVNISGAAAIGIGPPMAV